MMGLLVLLAAAGVVLWVLTRSWFIVGRVTPVLEQRLGGQVHIGSAAYEGNGRFVFRDLSLRTADGDDLAGEIATLGRATVQLQTGALWTGNIKITDVQLHNLLLRMSEDANQSGRFSFMDLSPQWDDVDRDDPMLPPRVDLPVATIEFGMHDGASYEPLGRRRVAGVLQPASVEHWYNAQLAEVDDTGAAIDAGVLINGQWNVITHEYTARLDGLVLDRSTYDMCPQAVRLWWDRMDLQGRLTNTKLRWNADAGLQVDTDVLDVGLTLPMQAEDWARYHDGRIVGWGGRQRMRVNSGSIHLRDDRLHLDELTGELSSPDGESESASVPYTVSMTLPELPDMNWHDRESWLRQVRDYTPFRMTFRLQDFHVTPDEHGNAPAVDLPLPVAEMLERFQIRDWTLSTNIEISRASAEMDDDNEPIAQRIESRGQLMIQNAAGAFEKFPYPLTDVSAHLTFDTDRAIISYVTGKGDNGVTMRLTGEIAPLGRHAGVDLHLVGTNVPVDDTLRAALPEKHMTIFDGLMHRESIDALRDSDALIDQPRLDELQQTRHDIQRRITALQATSDDDMLIGPQRSRSLRVLQQQADRIDALLQAGAFEPGGRVDLRVNIDREPGPEQPTDLTGEVDITSLHAAVEHFPYPFTVHDGMVRWTRDGAEIVTDASGRGLSIITQGGGRGHIAGTFTRTQRENAPDRIVPDVSINVINDELNPLMYRAMPDDENHTQSQATQLLRGIGLDGTVHYHGVITADDRDAVGYEFNVELADSTAEPTETLADALGDAGLIWPRGWTWEDVSAELRLSRDTIELLRFEGHRDDGTVHAAGVMDLRSDSDDASLDVRFDDLRLGRYLVDLFPSEQAGLARLLWQRYDPSGTFSAQLQLHRRNGDVLPPRLFIEPEQATLRIADETVTLQREQGGLTLHDGAVTMENLVLHAGRGAIDDGTLSFDGSYGAIDRDDEADVLKARGTWTGGRLESPLIEEVLGFLGAQAYATRLEKLQAEGFFDAAFDYESPRRDGQRRYTVKLTPHELSAVIDDQPLAVTFDEGSSLTVRPGRVELHEVAGRIREVGEFHTAGIVRFDDRINASLRLAFDGRVNHPAMRSILPDALSDVMDDVKFEDGHATQLRGMGVRLSQISDDDQPLAWRTDVHGTVQTNGASMHPGVEIKDMTGAFDVRLTHMPDRPLQLDAAARVQRMRVLSRTLTDVRTDGIAVSPDGRTLHFGDIRADAYGGSVTAAINAGLGDNLAYDTTVSFVGLSLGEMLDEQEDSDSRTEGEAFGTVQLGGERGRPETRSGRGSARATGRSISRLPLVFQMMQITQFNVPLQGDPGYADVIFYVDGDDMVFERILLESTVGDSIALQLLGDGRLDLNTMELDTQFRSRSGMLVLRDLLGGLSDRLYHIQVTGPLGDPDARIVPLPGLTQPGKAREQSTAASLREHPR